MRQVLCKLIAAAGMAAAIALAASCSSGAGGCGGCGGGPSRVPPPAREPAPPPPAQVTYTCPMHPQVVQSQPGDCPICGMALVRREQR